MKKWHSCDNYMGAEYTDYYILLDRNRDSGILENSNFDVALEILERAGYPAGMAEDGDKVIIVRSGHWAVGWVEFIGINADTPGAVSVGEEIESQLENYPILNEEDYYNRECETAREIWDNCYKNYSRDRVELLKEHGINPRLKNYDSVMDADSTGSLFMALVRDA